MQGYSSADLASLPLPGGATFEDDPAFALDSSLRPSTGLEPGMICTFFPELQHCPYRVCHETSLQYLTGRTIAANGDGCFW